MNRIFIILLTTITVSAFAQGNRLKPVSYSDPALSNLQLSDRSGRAVNTNMLKMGSAVKIQFTMANIDDRNEVPAGSCQLKITLGTKFSLETDMLNVQNLPLADYFHWKLMQMPNSKQYVITGELYRDLAPDFSGKVSFILLPDKVGTSTLVCQLMVSNHKNHNTILSDISPSNNYLSMSYTNVKPMNVKFISFDAQPHSCLVDLNWAIYDEDKVIRNYVIETSDNGIAFSPVQTVLSTGRAVYNYLLDRVSNTSLTVRIKAEAENGQYVYSENVFATNICNDAFDISLYPNPVAPEISEVRLLAKAGIFNGKYSIRIRDVMGKEMKQVEATFNNQVEVKWNTGFLTAGTYFITVTAENGKAITVKLIKL